MRINLHRTLLEDLSIPQLRPAFRRMAEHIECVSLPHPCLPQAALQANDDRTGLRREKARDGACKLELLLCLAEDVKDRADADRRD